MVVDTSTFKPDTPPPAYAPMAPSIPSIPTSSSGTGSTFSPPSSAAPSTSQPYPYNAGQLSQQQRSANSNTMAGQYQYQSPHAGQPYGPTPLSATQQAALLPYYDPRSPYALEQAVKRARWRFIGAMLWAVGIWVGVGLITGGIVVDIRHNAA